MIGELPRGPCRALWRAYQNLLFHRTDIVDRGQLWTGLWTSAHGCSSAAHRATAHYAKATAPLSHWAPGPPLGHPTMAPVRRTLPRHPCPVPAGLPLGLAPRISRDWPHRIPGHQPSCPGGQNIETRGLHNCTTRKIAAVHIHIVCVACLCAQ